MKIIKTILYFFLLSLFTIPLLASAVTKPPTWKPKTPTNFVPITWLKGKGVASFEKPPTGNGSIDFLTIIYLPYNHVQLISSSTPKQSWGPGTSPFATDTVQDWAVARMTAETAK